jgi:voltage-gated potassium channel
MAVPSTLARASRGEKARVLALSLLRTVLTVVALLWVFGSEPIPTSGQEVLDGLPLFLGALAVFLVVFVWQIHRIRKSRHPGLRAVEAGVTSLGVFLVAFASIYLIGQATSPGSFTQSLNHVQAMYFTVTVFATVGFGDITPVSDTMRVVVSIQMLLDLVFIGVLIKILFQVAQDAAKQRTSPADPPSGPIVGS